MLKKVFVDTMRVTKSPILSSFTQIKEQDMTQVTLKTNLNTNEALLHMAFDLSHNSWQLAFSDGKHYRYCSVEGKNLPALRKAISKAKQKFGLPEDCQVVSCFEAGRDGFWLHHHLESIGVHSLVVDSASIEVNRRKRQVKTDKIDAKKLLGMLMRHMSGERKHWSVVNVPSEEDEDLRRIQREIDRLTKEQSQHTTRMRSLINLHGIVIQGSIGGKDWETTLNQLQMWNGEPPRPFIRAELLRENERLILVRQQRQAQEKEKCRLLEEELENYPMLQQVRKLQLLRSIGKASSWIYIMEFFGWRKFKNRKEVGALSGLTPTPFCSGNGNREQGISKAGNKRIRHITIEIAWLWLRYQPQSALSLWYEKRFAQGGARMRRVGIVAMARKLLISLWRYLETDELPIGAALKPC